MFSQSLEIQRSNRSAPTQLFDDLKAHAEGPAGSKQQTALAAQLALYTI